jgi:glycosyltransferase involved in cell wall biosynthesis
VRLLHVIAELGYGGAERIVLRLAEDAARRGDAVAVASGGGPLVGPLLHAGARHYTIPLRQRSATVTLAAGMRLVGVLRAFRPDIVHAHNVRAATAAWAARRMLRRRPPLLTTLHGVPPAAYPTASRVLQLTGGSVIACAPAVARSLRAAGFPTDRLEVVVNCARLEPASAEERAALQAELGVGDRPLVVGIGRLAPEKSWTTLIEAAESIRGADIVVAGIGPLHAQLEAAAAGSGRVRFIGLVERPAALLGLASCAVSTSAWEGLPLALLEALSLGVPLVATAVGGVRDVVPPDGAILVPPNDPAAVAAGVNRVLEQPELAQRLSRTAQRAAVGWAPEKMLAGYRARYVASRSS